MSKKILLFIMMCLSPVFVMAQVELGGDLGFHITTNQNGSKDNSYNVNIPLSAIRVGYFVTPEIAAEVGANYNHQAVSGSAINDLGLNLGALYHLRNINSMTIPYAKVMGGMDYSSTSFVTQTNLNHNDTQFYAGGGIGIKVPVMDWLGLRFEGRYLRLFKSDYKVAPLPAANQFSILAGVSFFTSKL